MPLSEAGYGWIEDLNGATRDAPLPTGVGAVPLNINGGTRVGPGGAYLKPAMDRTEPHAADQHPGQADPDRRRPGGRRRVRRTRWRHRSDRGPNRAVRRRNRIGTSADAVRRRPAATYCGRGSAGGGRPAGRCGVRRPSGVGAAGGLDGDPRAAAARGGADHADGLEIRPYTAVSARWSAGVGTIRPTIRTSVWL